MLGARRGHVLALALLLWGTSQGARAQSQPILFSVTGDVPYELSELPVLEQHVADHNRFSPSEFFVHVGDILFGDCLEPRYAEVANALLGLAVPTFIVPGDNEWNDCDDPDQGWTWWETYLLGLEGSYCGTGPVEAQSVRPENFAFVRKGVLFLGINLVGGSVHDEDEWDLRMQQDADWVSQQLQQKRSQVRAAVIFSQAGPDGDKHDLFFTQFDPAAGLFGKPVLFVHGDGHAWRQDRPFLAQNVLRVQVERGDELPVQMTVGTNPLDPFEFERDPWDEDSSPLNRPPCVEVSSDLSIDLLEPALLDAVVSDDGVPEPPGSLATLWSRVSGPGTVSFANPAAVGTSATFSAAGVYQLRLEADDGELLGADELAVQVLSDEPRVTIDDVFANEGETAVFTVTLAAADGGLVTVDYATEDETAQAGEDYQGASGQVSFSGTSTQRQILVPTLQETLKEPAESFAVRLSNPTGAILFRDRGGAVILDDDTLYYSLDVQHDGPGHVDLDPPGGLYVEESVVTLTAVPDTLDSIFLGWSGSLTGQANPASLQMDANRAVTAHFVEVPGLGVVFRDAYTGGATGKASVSTSDAVAAVYDQLYLAAVSSSPPRAVTSVTGLGLAWSEVLTQCSSDDKTNVSVWQAQGAPTGGGPVTASLAGSADNAVVVVTRYAGVLVGAPIGAVASANPNGLAGECDDGGDDDEYAFPLLTQDRGSTVHAALAMRRRRHDPEDPWIERAEIRQGSDGTAASAAVEDAAAGFPGPVWVSGEFSSDTDYAAAALEIRRALEAPQTFALTVASAPGGDVSPPSGIFDAGLLVTLTASPDPGFAFTGWSGDLGGTENPASLLLDSDKSVTADFTPVHPLTVSVEGSGSVALAPPAGPYLEGTLVTLTASPDPGHAFSGWSGDLGGSANPATLLVDADRSVTARFTALHEVSVSVEGSGSVALAPPAGPYLEGTLVALTASPDPGHAFSGWSGDLGGSANPATLLVDADRSVTARFSALYSLGVIVEGNGHVEQSPSGSTHPAGTILSLTALPDPGSDFWRWEGGISGSRNPATLQLAGDTTVVARFGLPEPGSGTLGLAALVLVGGLARRLRRRADPTGRLSGS